MMHDIMVIILGSILNIKLIALVLSEEIAPSFISCRGAGHRSQVRWYDDRG